MNGSLTIIQLLQIAGLAFFISLIVSGLMIFAGLMDNPVARSNHNKAVPTGGGLGVGAGLGAGLLAVFFLHPLLGDMTQLIWVGVLACLVGLLGFLDDIYDIGAGIKFLMILLLACLCVTIIGPPRLLPWAMSGLQLPFWLGFLGAVLWVFVVVNAVNFMDGANGLMASVMMVAFFFLCWIAIWVDVPNVAILSALMSAGLAGFLPYNMRKNALVFCGDVGALLVGFIFAACVLILVAKPGNETLLYIGPLLILPFLCDVFLTLLLRARRQQNLLKAHRLHLFQRLGAAGLSQFRIVLFYIFAGLFAGSITLIGVHMQMIGFASFMIFWVVLAAVIYRIAHQYLLVNERDQQQTLPDP